MSEAGDGATDAGDVANDVPEGHDGRATGGTRRVEAISVILLGIAATLTAVSAFLSAGADGDQLAGFNEATQALNDANFFYQKANQTQAQDSQLFIAYLEAEQSGQESGFIARLMSPELQAAIEDWLERDDIVSPLQSELYVQGEVGTDIAEAESQQARSTAALGDARDAGDEGDSYDLANVVFALALFAAGIVNVFKRRGLQTVLLGVAGAMVVLGSGVLLSA